MDKYIDREAFLAAKRKVYCDDCNKRKNSKGKMVYDIGDAPCRACGVGDMLDDVEDFPAADVVERKHGEWLLFDVPEYMVLTHETPLYCCSKCTAKMSNRTNFCPNCGAIMEKDPFDDNPPMEYFESGGR